MTRLLQTVSTALCLALCALTAHAAPLRPQMRVTGYVINADLQPATQKLSVTAQVTFTALEDLLNPT